VALLWRAVRILIDVGLHTRELPVDRAVDMLVDRVGVDRASAEREVRLCCASPTYQTCYAAGKRELVALRDDVRAAAGERFALRDFHDAVLGYGGIPFSMMRWRLGLGG
jgi:uncharacterized protein (DUF885 family)